MSASTSSKRMWNLVVVFLFLAIFIIVPLMRYQRSGDSPEDRTFINLGLDLKGGVDLVLEVNRDQYKGEVTQEQMDGAIEVMRRKIDPAGVMEIVVQQVGKERIAVQVPGVENSEDVKKMIGRPDLLKWVDMGEVHLEKGDLVEFITDVSVQDEESTGETSDSEASGAEGEEIILDSNGDEVTNVDSDVEAMTASEEPEGSSAESEPVDITDGGTVEATDTLEDAGFEFSEDAFFSGEEAEVELIKINIDPSSDDNQLVLTGENLDWVQTTFYSNKPIISFKVSRKASGAFAKHTGSHIGKHMAIILNTEVIACPKINARIGRSGQIDGFTVEQAKELELLLNAGRIPVPLKVVQERTVSPTLGAESIKLSLRAGIIGFCLVLVFMVAYYRLPGLLADLALIMYSIFFLGAMSMLNATLTLPGIAGIILSLGMAVDANVIIFERLKEELRAGKTVTTAVKDAFRRAWSAILDANVTTLITGFILWSVGSGPIKGFAVTLCLGILLSMFTALFVTRNLLEAIVTQPSMQKRWLLGGKGGK